MLENFQLSNLKSIKTFNCLKGLSANVNFFLKKNTNMFLTVKQTRLKNDYFAQWSVAAVPEMLFQMPAGLLSGF